MPQLPSLPGPFRAALGLAVEAAEQARQFAERPTELPMRAVSTALQLSIRAQQRYAVLTAKGDAILNHRPATDEPPEWATFDDPPASPGPSRFDVISGGEDGHIEFGDREAESADGPDDGGPNAPGPDLLGN